MDETDREERRRSRDARLSRAYRKRQRQSGVPSARTLYAVLGQALIEQLAHDRGKLDPAIKTWTDEILLEAKARLLRSSTTHTKAGIVQRTQQLHRAALAAIKARAAIRAIDPSEQNRRGTPATWSAFEKVLGEPGTKLDLGKLPETADDTS